MDSFVESYSHKLSRDIHITAGVLTEVLLVFVYATVTSYVAIQ